jgi:histidinol dehydrogenase
MTHSIRIIRGLEAGREHITSLRSRSDASVPSSVQLRLEQLFGRHLSPSEAVAQIVADVRQNGDEAVLDYTRRIDGASLDEMSVDAGHIEAGYSATDDRLREALHLAAVQIRAYHTREPVGSWLQWEQDGGTVGQMIRPLHRVGVYVPGGRAAYPSSLLMSVIPAQVAGVEEIIITTPPGPGGVPDTAILAAARILGVERVFQLGGAQAVAALAYGTQTVPAVDKIVGAGGLFVTLAKKHVSGDVGIDGLYGPTETLLIADETADPKSATADMLAQAEHDPLATALLITPSDRLAVAVQTEADRQLPLLHRGDIIAESLRGQGAIILLADLDEALSLANEYSPEHLCLLVANPWPLIGRVRNAGGVFVGHHASEALGDYVLGPSHIMPTGGTARFASPLHVRDFLKVTSVFAPAPETTQRLSPAAHAIALAEGLTAHARAIALRAGWEASADLPEDQ